VAGAAVAEAEAAASATEAEDRRAEPALIEARAQALSIAVVGLAVLAEPGRGDRVFEAKR